MKTLQVLQQHSNVNTAAAKRLFEIRLEYVKKVGNNCLHFATNTIPRHYRGAKVTALSPKVTVPAAVEHFYDSRYDVIAMKSSRRDVFDGSDVKRVPTRV